MNPFEHIYNTNYWGFGSGHGSLPSVTKAYRAYIEDFLIENKIDSILDYGCGDWQFSRLIRWGNVRYTGVDIADAVIEMNQRKYGSKNIRFKTINPGSTEIPDADLLISKDVLQHMTRSDIEIFLKNILPRYKLALITNCITPEERLNIDIPSGEFRP
jgi:SAM-dependent methyltransferase